MSFVKSIVGGQLSAAKNPFDIIGNLTAATGGKYGPIGLTAAGVKSLLPKSNRGAVTDQIAADAAATSKAQIDAANEANQLRVAQKRAYQANVLALGGNDDDTLGTPGATSSVLARGATPAQQAASVAPTVSVLGGGAPLMSSAGGPGGSGSRLRSYARSAQ